MNFRRATFVRMLSSLKWVETHLEETDAEDVLMLPEEVSSLSVNGYVAHPLFALVVLIEYTIR